MSGPTHDHPAGAVSGPTHDRPAGAPTAVVLIVDDSRTKRYVIRSWLRRAGYGVLEATNGAEALVVMDAEPVDAVVLDVRLPDASGFEVCERIKRRPANHAVPVVHVSATAVSAEDRATGLASGADAYLAEPIDPDELLVTIRTMLQLYRTGRRAEQLSARLSRLTRATTTVSDARSTTELLLAAVDGAALIFESPAVASIATADGNALVAGIRTAGSEPTVGGRTVGERGESTGGDGVVAGPRWEPASRWSPVAPCGSDGFWVVTVRLHGDRPSVRVGIAGTGAAQPIDASALVQLGHVVALAAQAFGPSDSTVTR